MCYGPGFAGFIGSGVGFLGSGFFFARSCAGFLLLHWIHQLSQWARCALAHGPWSWAAMDMVMAMVMSIAMPWAGSCEA